MKTSSSLLLSTVLIWITVPPCALPQGVPRLVIESGNDDALIVRSANNHNWRVGPNSGAGTGFGLFDETANATRLKIDNNGNVGIGTATPAAKLHIAGNVQIDGALNVAGPQPTVAVPVGGVIMWWGSLASIPPNFELCDGGQPTTLGATLGSAKPNLVDLFPKGTTNERTDVRSPVGGGSHTIGERNSGGTAITTDQMPSHSHGVNDPGHRHNVPARYWVGTQLDFVDFGTSPRQDNPSGDPPTTVATTGITIQTAGGGQSHSHTIPAHDNRPAFLEIFFIIRVK